MPGVKIPNEGELPSGPRRDLVLALHELYGSAGKPAVRQISEMIRERHDLPGTLSHEGVSSALRGVSVPRWSNLESLVRVLVERSVVKLDVEDVVLRIHRSWLVADGHTSVTAESAVQDNRMDGIVAAVSDEREQGRVIVADERHEAPASSATGNRPGASFEYRVIMLIDIVDFDNPARVDPDRFSSYEALHGILQKAIRESGISWDSCVIQVTRDAARIMFPAEISEVDLVVQLPDRLLAEIRRFNAKKRSSDRMRLRIALNAGEVLYAELGGIGDAVDQAFQLVNSSEGRVAQAEAGAVLCLIVPDRFYQEFVVVDPAADPEGFGSILDPVDKGLPAWLRLLGSSDRSWSYHAHKRNDRSGLEDVRVSELITELKLLRKGRGILTTPLDDRVGPILCTLCEINKTDTTEEVRQKISGRLRGLSSSLPPDLRLAVSAAFALDERVQKPFYQERVALAAAALGRATRTVHRRIDEGIDRLARLALAAEGPDV